VLAAGARLKNFLSAVMAKLAAVAVAPPALLPYWRVRGLVAQPVLKTLAAAAGVADEVAVVAVDVDAAAAATVDVAAVDVDVNVNVAVSSTSSSATTSLNPDL